ncbi:hypothetical protein M9Y10_021598 [Tritrichomonas musculus]|uniref:DUF3447 domain-containing protein n=1 Tax=Tritrichomonas musculus TaxID=1915356 RepID=A0ABR2KPU7_9EUKA
MDPQALISEYLEKLKQIQENILQYIEKSDDSEDDFQNINKIFEEQNVKEDRHKLKELLHLIIHISSNHRRNALFFKKIERIILIFKDIMTNFYSVEDLFNIFKNNKRMLLFLFREEIIPPRSTMISTISNEKFKGWLYPNYFFPEFKPIYNTKLRKEISEQNQKLITTSDNNVDTPEIFEKNRLLGENNSEFCQLIRNDSFEEFKNYVTKTNLSLTSTIEPSIYETNTFLLKRTPTLIEYSAFYGSVNIFKYLQSNQVELTPSLWLYAVHGQNIDLLNILKDSQIKPEDETYRQCYLEAIKCHHIEICEYLSNNGLKLEKGDYGAFIKSLRVFNIKYFPTSFDSSFNIFYDFCEFDYFYIVTVLLNSTKIDLNARRISYFIQKK